MEERFTFLLATRLLEVVKESGANREQAIRALRVAELLVPELELTVQPTLSIET
jgi:hypothetical protein